jgi:hypothetical protein
MNAAVRLIYEAAPARILNNEPCGKEQKPLIQLIRIWQEKIGSRFDGY